MINNNTSKLWNITCMIGILLMIMFAIFQKQSFLIETKAEEITCFGISSRNDRVCSGNGYCLMRDFCICNISNYQLSENCSVIEVSGQVPLFITSDNSLLSMMTISTTGQIFGHCKLGADGNCHSTTAAAEDLGYGMEVLSSSYLKEGIYCSSVRDLTNDPRCSNQDFRKQQYYEQMTKSGEGSSSASFNTISIPSNYRGEPTNINLSDVTTGITIKCLGTILTDGPTFGSTALRFYQSSDDSQSVCTFEQASFFNIIYDAFSIQFWFSLDEIGRKMTLLDSHSFKATFDTILHVSVFTQGFSPTTMNVNYIYTTKTFYNVVVSRDSTGFIQVSINGEAIVTVTGPTPEKGLVYSYPSFSPTIGRDAESNTNHFAGTISNIDIQPRSISPSEIRNDISEIRFSCYGTMSLDSYVCSGNGYCIGEDTCKCKVGFIGKKCETKLSCFGVPYNQSNVCSGNGNCISMDTCVCNHGFQDKDCSKIITKKDDALCTYDGVFSDYSFQVEQVQNTTYNLNMVVKKLSVCNILKGTPQKLLITNFTTAEPIPNIPKFLDKFISQDMPNQNSLYFTLDSSISSGPSLYYVNADNLVESFNLISVKISKIISTENTLMVLAYEPVGLLSISTFNKSDFQQIPITSTISIPVLTKEEAVRYSSAIKKGDNVTIYMPYNDQAIIVDVQSLNVTVRNYSLSFNSGIATVINTYQPTSYYVNVDNTGMSVYEISNSDQQLKYFDSTKTVTSNPIVFTTNNGFVVSSSSGDATFQSFDPTVDPVNIAIKTVYLPKFKAMFFETITVEVNNSTGNYTNSTLNLSNSTISESNNTLVNTTNQFENSTLSNSTMSNFTETLSNSTYLSNQSYIISPNISETFNSTNSTIWKNNGTNLNSTKDFNNSTMENSTLTLNETIGYANTTETVFQNNVTSLNSSETFNTTIISTSSTNSTIWKNNGTRLNSTQDFNSSVPFLNYTIGNETQSNDNSPSTNNTIQNEILNSTIPFNMSSVNSSSSNENTSFYNNSITSSNNTSNETSFQNSTFSNNETANSTCNITINNSSSTNNVSTNNINTDITPNNTMINETFHTNYSTIQSESITCFNIPKENSTVCGGKGICSSKDYCSCSDGFTGHLCQYETKSKICVGKFSIVDRIIVQDRDVYFETIYMDLACGKSIPLDKVLLISSTPEYVDNTNIFKYYHEDLEIVNGQLLNRFLSFDSMIMQNIPQNNIIFWRIDPSHNITKLMIALNGTDGILNSTFGKVKLISKDDSKLGLAIADNSTLVSILSIDLVELTATLENSFNKGTITFSNLANGNDVKSGTSSSVYTIFKESDDNSLKFIAIDLESSKSEPKEVTLPPQNNEENCFSIILECEKVQYILSSGSNLTTISSVYPNILSENANITQLASNNYFTVSKDNNILVKKQDQTLVITNTDTEISLTIDISKLTPSNMIFSESSTLSMTDNMLLASALDTSLTSSTSVQMSVSLGDVSIRYVPIVGSVRINLEGKLPRISREKYLVFRYGNNIINRLPIQSSMSGENYVDKQVDIVVPEELKHFNNFTVSLFIELVSDTSIFVSTDIDITIFKLEIQNIEPKYAFHSDYVYIQSSFFPPVESFSAILIYNMNSEIVTCKRISTSICAIKVPLFDLTDTVIQVKLKDDPMSDHEVTFRYVDPSFVTIASLESFNTSIEAPSIPGLDESKPIIEQQETREGKVMIFKLNHISINRSRCDAKPIRQLVTSSQLFDISNLVSLKFKLTTFNSLQSGNLIEFWVTKQGNGTLFAFLSLEYGKPFLRIGETDQVKQSSICQVEPNTFYSLSIQVSSSDIRWELRNNNLDIIECSAHYPNNQILPFTNSQGFKISVGQSFSCLQIVSNVTEIPSLMINDMKQVNNMKTPTLIQAIEENTIMYLGITFGILFSIPLLCICLIAAACAFIRNRKKKKQIQTKYIYYDEKTNRNKENTLDDLFQKMASYEYEVTPLDDESTSSTAVPEIYLESNLISAKPKYDNWV